MVIEHLAGRSRSVILESQGSLEAADDRVSSRSEGPTGPSRSSEAQKVGVPLPRSSEKGPKSRLGKEGGGNSQPSDMELMKERFAKLLLGEDMSGSGKGVSSALALSNAITNLAASVFGERWRLEPMAVERKARWRREIDLLLSVTDHIVEFVPSQQVSKDGTNMEIMVTQQRRDLLMNIPALRKLDAMLIEYLDNFKDHQEFTYVSRDANESEKGGAKRKDDKWWLPTVKVPPNGLSEVSRKWLQYQKELVNQVLKAAMAINANVLMEMEIPEAYIESLPKNGRESLGDSIYKSITVDVFDPDDMEKREQFEERAETILLIIKHRFPGIPQSSLDISKIQYNKDVGYSILESYSRILESLAYNVMSRIDDVLYADSLARDPNLSKRRPSLTDSELVKGTVRTLDPKEEIEKLNKMEAPASMTLSDFMGWQLDQDTEEKKKDSNNLEDTLNVDAIKLKKPPNIVTNKKFSYIEKLQNLGGLRSPTARH
uniref:PRONE domain-containing protein n=1 Tax=Ananas comosus var. bracteatus TaxID=296719 RepID=A0A6V7NYM1_ANACO|nr:unnamed protein product [Ananas comosus var. bracteatus]